MRARWMASFFAAGIAAATLLAAPAAWADRVALLPSRGGGTDPNARPALDADLARGLAALGHTLVTPQELALAMSATVADGVADTLDEYRALGTASRADWVLVGAAEPAVTSVRVELTACLVRMGRVESVAREVSREAAGPQVQEMLAVLVRPEGIGTGDFPWEKRQQVVVPPAPPMLPPPPMITPPPLLPAPAPPIEGRAHIDYAAHGHDGWPVYSLGKRGFFGVHTGVAGAVARPGSPPGSGVSMVGAVRGGYAAGDLGIEPFAEFGGNIVGPQALWIAAGARWMLNPTMNRGTDGLLRGVSFYIGPELLAGAFVQLGTSTTGPDGTNYSRPGSGHAMLGAALDVVLGVTPSFQLEAALGNLRWIPGGDGSIVLLGATLGASIRF